MPTVYNKVTANGTTLIDLSQDTVTQASHIVSGYVGHLADGTQVTGTGGGGDTWVTLVDGQFTIIQGPNRRAIESYGYTVPIAANEHYRVTWGNATYTYTTIVDPYGYSYDGYIFGNLAAVGGTDDGSGIYVFFEREETGDEFVLRGYTSDAVGTKYLKVEKKISGSVPKGTAGTPTASKGTVSSHSVSVTPSVTNTAGYIMSGTLTGTAVTVSASELVSGSETKTANGTYDVTNLASLVVNVSGGGGSASTATGTFTGSGTDVATISCDFKPDLIYVHGDLTGSASLRGIITFIIIRDTQLIVTNDGSSSGRNEGLFGANAGITDLNQSISPSEPYADYSNGTLTLDTVINSGGARWASGITYSYKLVKWS